MAKTPKTVGFAPAEDVRALYVAKLASSGITPEQAAAAGMDHLDATASRAAGLWHQGLPALRIPYFDPWTGARMAPAPHWPPFWRARCLRMPLDPPKGFAKYLQPPDTGVCAYFPRVAAINWPEVLGDYRQMLLITEGELKAAKACVEGYPTIALGGVWNFQTRHPEANFLPELEKIIWPRRIVYICYDSDVLKNPQVAKAAWRLAEELRDRGAMPRLAVIPSATSDKQGLDDFLVAEGPEALEGVLREARTLTAVQCLWSLNDRYALLTEGDREVADMHAGARIKAEQLRYRTAAKFDERRLTPTGQISYEPVNAAAAWIDWPMRQEARRLLFDPSQPPKALVPARDAPTGTVDFNTWPGFAVDPKPGDITPFSKLIDHVFGKQASIAKAWFLDWLAYPLQHPGAKLFSAVVIFGIQGSGKTLIGETMRRIYGKTFTVVGNAELARDFNEWAEGKCFILGDDITGFDKMEIHDRLKKMITQSEVRVNIKNVSPYTLDDHVNWMFTTNRAGALYIDDDDRRYFVHEVPKTAGRLPRQQAIAYLDWLDSKDGASILFHCLLQRDLSGFDPGAPPPDTSSKDKMREAGRSPVVTWAADLARDPGAMLVWNKIPVEGDLFTSSQLVTFFADQTGTRDDAPHIAKRMSNALIDAGLSIVHGGKIVTCEGRSPARYYAVRNPERWLAASLAEIQQHLAPEHYGAKGRAVPVRKTTPGKKY